MQAARCFLAALIALSLPQSAAAHDWRDRLKPALARLEATSAADLGVYVRDLSSGATVSHRADERWYLASMIKLPVAIVVLRGVERGDYTLQTRLTLRASDYVDGAGPTNIQSIGTRLSIAQLLERMIVHSDNTASDMLIGLVGVDAIHELLRGIDPAGFGAITSLGDVRRHVYAQLSPAAMRLSGIDLLQLRRLRSDADRLDHFSRITGVARERFDRQDLAEAYALYYASGLNSGRLDAYGVLLERLAQGRLLDPERTTYLLDVMGQVATGAQRLKAGLPPETSLAHKTGTQRERTCDAGIAKAAGSQHLVVVVACISGETSLVKAERMLARVGAAVGESGALLAAEVR